MNRKPLASATTAIALSVAVFSLTFFFAGCAESTVEGSSATTSAKDIEAARTKYVASSEPAETVSVDEFFAKATGADKVAEGKDPPSSTTLTTEPVEVALMGRIGGAPGSSSVVGDEFPWHAGKAAFVMSDPSADFDAVAEASAEEHASEDHEHAEGDDDHAEATPKKSAHKDDCPCPFCANGKTAPPQAIVQFLGENGEPISIDARELFDLKGDEIVVVEGSARMLVGMLMVDAKKIYVRR